MKPFAIISDLHFHNWSAFAQPDEDGINGRLVMLLQEVWRAVEDLQDHHGDTLIVAGDVFHVRGSVAPSVLNPVLDLFKRIVARGVKVYILAGNHDLEGKLTSKLGSAVTALESVGCVCVSDDVRIIQSQQDGGAAIGMIPWIDNLDELRKQIESMSRKVSGLVIHAPLDGVIKGIPNAGLDPFWLNTLDFGAVWSGHYHNHKSFPGDIYSIGALAHHSWSDVGSRAGYLMVYPTPTRLGCVFETKFRASHCPSFVELAPGMEEADMKLAGDGNYVRARVATADLKALTAIKKMLLDAGAKGVTLIPEPEQKTASRAATAVKQGMTLDESVASFIDAGTFEDKPALTKLCADLLSRTRAVA